MTEEYERYMIEQAAAWLKRVRRLVAYAADLKATAEAKRELADNLKAMDYSAVRVSQSASPDAIPDAVAAYYEAVDAMDSIAQSAAEKVAQAAIAISKLEDPAESRCLHLYYVDCLDTWEHVCVKMGYSYDGMMKLRRRAMLHAYGVMPHYERDPMEPAI